MSAAKQILLGLENVIKEATKVGYKKGAETVLDQFAPHAGRALKNGDGSVMKTFNEIRRTIKKKNYSINAIHLTGVLKVH